MFGHRDEDRRLRPQAVLFDMDGVLLDSMPWHVRAWLDAFSEFGLPSFHPELFYLHEGAIEPETAVEIFRSEGVSMTPSLFHEVFRRQKEIFKSRYRQNVAPYPEVPELLEELAAHDFRMALVTSSHRDVLSEVLPEKIIDFMSVVITGDEVQRRKPWPDPYLAGMARLGVAGDRAVVIENAPAGIRAAKGADAACIALSTTLSKEHLEEADLVVRDHAELKQILLP